MKITYRPEIDGLRAIAVLSVIVFHFKENLLPGGFLGVDIFFVISGYLITSLIIKELKLSKKFSFGNFFLRRARRILPAMLFVIFVTIVVSYFFLLPSEFNELINSAFFGIFFSSNFYFNNIDQSYWSNLSSTKPLLNLWSLSLEEQFYLIFPLILVIVYKNSKNYLLTLLTSIFTISFLWSLIYNIGTHTSSFYLLHARIWEFIPGSLLAIYQDRLNYYFKYLNKYVFTILGVLIFVIILFFFNKIDMNIIFFNLLAVSGTCLLILFTNPGSFFFNILSNKLLVFVGLISYSLYLIHYPLIIIYRSFYYQLEHANNNIYEEITIIVILFSLSVFSYLFIEKTFRNKKIINSKKFFIGILFTIFMILTTSFYLLSQNNKLLKTNFSEINIDNSFYANEYEDNFIEPQNTISKNKKNFLIIGDSQGNNFYMSLVLNQNRMKGLNFNYINVNEIKCFYILYFATNEKNNCNNRRLSLSQINLIDKSDYVFFTKRWTDEDLNYLEKFINKIDQNERIIVSNQNVPFKIIYEKITPLDLFIIMNKKLPNKKELKILETKYYSYYSGNLKFKEMNKKLEAIALKNKIKFIDRTLFQCVKSENKCFVISENNKKLVYDIDHFTLDGAKFFGKKFIESDDLSFFIDIN